MIRLALFADIHGKFLLPFKLAHHYQQTTGKSIDLIVQCGDMGAFPDKSRMDKATLRHAARDRDELGFMDDFVHAKLPIAQFLERLNLNMLCVRGNHEDHEFLDELERQSVQAAFQVASNIGRRHGNQILRQPDFLRVLVDDRAVGDAQFVCRQRVAQ